MKQLLQSIRDGKALVVDVPAPSVRRGMALVRTGASLVSAGTERMIVDFAGKSLLGKARSRPDLVRQLLDKARREGILPTLNAAFTRLDQPMALGYSSAGTVVEVGEGLNGFQVGDRVACAGSGFAVHAEYAVAPQNLLVKLPDAVSFEEGAFATLGAIALNGLRLCEPRLGERIAVVGMGLLGLLAAQMARAAGCSVLGIDISPARVELARKMGFEAALRADAETVGAAFTRGMGFDGVLLCADTKSSDPVELAGALARDRGRVVAVGAFGLDIPRRPYYDKELTFQVSRSYGPGRYDPSYEERGVDYPAGFVRWTEGRNLEAVIDLIARGDLDVKTLITHRFVIEEAAGAYDLISGKTGRPFLGVVLTYPQPESGPAVPAAAERRVAFGETRPRVGGEPALGVLGAGNYASAVFLPAVARAGGAARIGIASGGGLSARHAAQKYGFGFASSNASEVLDNPEINVIAVLTRHDRHAREVLAALRGGKHVYCEKPLALKDADLDEIEAALRAENAPLLTVGFNRRFAPLAARLRQVLGQRAEPLMATYRVNAGYIPLTHWVHDPEAGGGRIAGEGCHFIDFLTFLVGAAPQRVQARALPDGGRYRQDNALITLEFADGSLGSIVYAANGDKSMPKERVEVFCGGVSAVLDDFSRLEVFRGGRADTTRLLLGQDKGHQAAWSAFLAAVRAGGPPPIAYEQVLGVSRMTLEAARQLKG